MSYKKYALLSPMHISRYQKIELGLGTSKNACPYKIYVKIISS
jgi:hypothetical protein